MSDNEPSSSSDDPAVPRSWRQRFAEYLLRRMIALPLFLLGVWFLPYLWCAREADAWFDGEAATQRRLANGVATWVQSNTAGQKFSTGSARFDGEWLFGAYMMAAMGFGQTALEHPEWREEHLRRMDQCLARLVQEDVQQFSTDAWGQKPLETLESDEQHHAAYLGYFNLALSLRRCIEPDFELAPLNDQITAALVRRIEQSPTMLLRTYPSEVYPVDNAAVLASIALHMRATGTDHQGLVDRWIANCRADWIDPESGLLIQSVDGATGEHLDEPRGSGTALAAYFLTYADEPLAGEMYQAIHGKLRGSICSFGMVKEYPASSRGGRGDIDSGPLVLGYSISATGFSLASARVQEDREFFRRLYATSYLFGGPTDRAGCRNYVSGGPLGDAILFAVLTAGPLPDAKANHAAGESP